MCLNSELGGGFKSRSDSVVVGANNQFRNGSSAYSSNSEWHSNRLHKNATGMPPWAYFMGMQDRKIYTLVPSHADAQSWFPHTDAQSWFLHTDAVNAIFVLRVTLLAAQFDPRWEWDSSAGNVNV